MFFLLLQAANVHAGINGVHFAIMILEDCRRGVEMHSFGTKGPGEKFLVFQNECAKNLFKTFYKANYHRKAKRTETTGQLLDRQHHRLQLVDRQHHRLQLLDRQHHRLQVMDRQ